MIDPIPDSELPPTRGVVLHHAAAVYDLLVPAMFFFTEGRLNRHAASLLKLRPGDQVLDIGCATGRVTLEIARYLNADAGGLAVGLDASPQMIARARHKVRRRPVRFDLGLAESLPYGDGVFDKAVSTMFFHHLRLEDKLATLKHIARVLKPGGRFALVDVDVPTTWLGRLCVSSGQLLFDQPELRENTDGKLPPLFAEAGFTWERVAHNLGYISTFLLRKPQ